MRVQDIEIHAGEPDFEFTPIRRLEAKCESATALSPAPSIDEMNAKLREMAVSLGANAIINVKYDSGVSLTSWRSMKGTGLAVKKAAEDIACPVCAEPIKRAAVKCRFCGADVAALSPQVQTQAEPDSLIGVSPTAAELQEPLRATNNPQWWIWASVAVFVIFMFITMSH